MMRRFIPCLIFFATGGGTAFHVAAQLTTKPDPIDDTEEVVGVYLPWTARPWEVTHSVHHAQWKFLDTVFAHLATVTPAELSERAREQGARDVLCDLEEPVIALRRQLARQARQQRRQEREAAQLAAAVPSMTPIKETAEAVTTTKETGVKLKRGVTDPFSSLMSVSLSPATANREDGNAEPSWTSSLSPPPLVKNAKPKQTVTDHEMDNWPKASGKNAQSALSSELQADNTHRSATKSATAETEEADGVQGGVSVVVETQSSARNNSSSKKTKAKKQKRNKKSVDVIHYV